MVLGAMLSATVFVLPFKVAARGGRGGGAALGLMAFVVLLYLPRVALRFRSVPALRRRGALVLASKLAAAAALGNIAQGYAFETLHPGVASTVIQMNLLFVAFLGALWLRESLSRAMILGLLLVTGGLWVAQLGGEGMSMSWERGIFWALLAAFGFSLLDVLSRRESHRADPVLTNGLRALGGAVLLAFVPGAIAQLSEMSSYELGALATAAFFGPGLARELLIRATVVMPAVEVALLQQLRGLLALPMASVVFGHWPSWAQWLGCLLILAGVTVPFLLELRKRRAAQEEVI